MNRIAVKQARKAIEILYDSTCTVIEYRKEKDPVTKVTSNQEVIIHLDKSCRLSYSSKNKANQTDTANAVEQVIKVFIAPELDIKAGSKLVISSKGRMVEYKNSGVPAVYDTHQEIILELFKGWA
ncbi:hypothetical protein [Lachnoclostridium phytofermentans]|uniref:Phage protein n=1 Tax=Lachnoclostridium phytofermentans (strain ATCC 700394 / DSM 18823 / ISDg) TaxID=357809 RepID=A9KQ07_LACP7|nr:hypothetical protein [Lachnoclostridium phytofermentans]ABX43319.1 phage protein [Lachnoclostridium phytofermentans ISDg]